MKKLKFTFPAKPKAVPIRCPDGAASLAKFCAAKRLAVPILIDDGGRAVVPLNLQIKK